MGGITGNLPMRRCERNRNVVGGLVELSRWVEFYLESYHFVSVVTYS